MTKLAYQLVFSTCPDEASARHIAEALVTEKLAACVNTLPGIQSVYRWKNNIEHDKEVLLIIKTKSEHYAQLQQTIRRLHPYELPEIVAVSIDTGLKDYLHWIDSALDVSP